MITFSFNDDKEPNRNINLTWQKIIGLKSGQEQKFLMTIECDGTILMSDVEVFKPGCCFCDIFFPNSSSPQCDVEQFETDQAELVLHFNSTKRSLFAKLNRKVDSSQYKSYRHPHDKTLKKDHKAEILSLDDLYETLNSQRGNIEFDSRNLKLCYVNGKSVSIKIRSKAAASLFASVADHPFSRVLFNSAASELTVPHQSQQRLPFRQLVGVFKLRRKIEYLQLFYMLFIHKKHIFYVCVNILL